MGVAYHEHVSVRECDRVRERWQEYIRAGGHEQRPDELHERDSLFPVDVETKVLLHCSDLLDIRSSLSRGLAIGVYSLRAEKQMRKEKGEVDASEQVLSGSPTLVLDKISSRDGAQNRAAGHQQDPHAHLLAFLVREEHLVDRGGTDGLWGCNEDGLDDSRRH